MSVVIAVLLLASAPANSQTLRARAADVFQLTGGERILGVSLGPSASDSRDERILVRASWLQKNLPELYEEVLNQQETEQASPLQKRLEDHIERLRTAQEPDIHRITFLEERLVALFPGIGERLPVPDVVILTVPSTRVRQRLNKRPSFRRAAGVAILNDLKNAETGTPAELNRALNAIAPAQLIRQLPKSGQLLDESVFQRVLLQADWQLGKIEKLILQSGAYISEKNAERDMALVAMKMMTSQVQGQLQQLLREANEGPRAARFQGAPRSGDLPRTLPAAAVAQISDTADLLEVTTMGMDPSRGTASVQIGLYRPDGQRRTWTQTLQVQAQASTQDVANDRADEIAQDPRVQQVSKLFQGLGVGNAQLRQAFSIGAVVEAAQERAKKAMKDRLFGTQAGGPSLTVFNARLPVARPRENSRP